MSIIPDMPNIKPLNKLVTKARNLRDHHSERHRPSGFGFALADSIGYLDPAHWDAVTAHDSLFLSRRYLRVLEEAGPENLFQRYALIFRGREPVAAVAAQSVTVSVARMRKKPASGKAGARLERLEEKMLVCGNLLSWGMHGISFAPNQDTTVVWPAVAEAIYRLRRADKLSGDTDFVMVKDIPDAHAAGAAALSRFSYRELETEPNMVLEISPQWRTYEDYMASLTSKYRKQAKQIEKEVAAAGCSVEEISGQDVARHAEHLHSLYMQTHRNARLRLVTLPVTFLPTLAARLGDDMLFTVVRRDDQLLGFVTTVRDGETAVGYYIGFDRKANADFPIYFRLLQAVVDHAIRLGCRKLSLGRTALEPKARLGARPEPLRIWIRHRLPMFNVVVRGLLHTISDHDEPPERNPFK
ncbi:MAG: GNAT family N-acetyltransferase [Pyrinomonadaceae bacterium]|nr:GNAT family N-acetyltransferase [Pyrinomonadaceae bacterium]